MRARSLNHLTDQALLRDLDAIEVRDHKNTADLLEHLAEVDHRRLYVAAGYPSMFAWCVEARHYSEDAAYKRIQAARTARRFPRPDAPAQVRAIAPPTPEVPCGVAPVATTVRSDSESVFMRGPAVPGTGTHDAGSVPGPAGPLDGPVCLERGGDELAPGQVRRAAERPRVAPLAPQRYSIQFTMDGSMHADLVRAQELLGRGAAGQIPEVFGRALRELVTTLEKQKFAATNRPRAPRRPAQGRQIPAALRREVWERDQGRCTFVAGNGHRCRSRDAIEFDHVVPVARGGKSTVENVRLRCRAHNQYEAECAFGEGFMHGIRERARRPAAAPARGPCPGAG